MNFIFHDGKQVRSALPRLETRIGLADDVDTTLAPDNLTIRVTAFGTLEGGNDFHKEAKTNNPAAGVNNLEEKPPIRG